MDGLRGLAAILVVIFHFSGAGPFGRPAPSAYLAVDLFFLLSGFVIALAYEQKLRSGMSLTQFAWVRMIRLYPLALLGTLVSAAALAAPALQHPDPARLAWVARDALKGALFLPHLRGGNDLFPLNPPMWSLLFEIGINLFYAAALPWLTNRLLVVIVGVGGIGVIASAVEWGGLDIGGTTGTALGGLARVTWSFPLGVLIYRHWRDGKLDLLPQAPPAVLLAVLVICCLPTQSRYSPVTTSLTVLVVFPVWVLLAVRAEPLGRMRQVFGWLGMLSYPLYAVHWGLLRWGWVVSSRVGESAAITAAALLALPAAYVASRWWDEPLRKRLSRIGHVTPKAVTAAPPL